MSKKTVAVLFGGQSSEHEVSCVSAVTIISNIDKEQFDVLIIGITKDGKWLKVESVDEIPTGAWKKSKVNAIISPDASSKAVLIIEGSKIKTIKLDVVFPALHGKYGEDGTIQGLLELAGIAYVGCDVISSAIAMDKVYTKVIADSIGVRQADYVLVNKSEISALDDKIGEVERRMSYPVFVKPSSSGSSQGVSKATNRDELINGIKLAAEHDSKILVEETIIGRELECAILGGNEVKASGVGEIISSADFYDYDAKYNSEESKTVVKPELPDGVEKEVKDTAIRIFKAIGGYGMARVDFFLKTDTNEVIFNEINTIPGFTGISMYSMLWEARGISQAGIITKLIQSAIARADD